MIKQDTMSMIQKSDLVRSQREAQLSIYMEMISTRVRNTICSQTSNTGSFQFDCKLIKVTTLFIGDVQFNATIFDLRSHRL